MYTRDIVEINQENGIFLAHMIMLSH